MRIRKVALGVLLSMALAGQALAQDWSTVEDGKGYQRGDQVIMASTTPQLPSDVVATALAFLDIPYTWAGTSPTTGFDCSGFIYEVLHLNGYEVPRMADQQFEATERVSREDLQPGDLVFFTTYLPGPSHVGFYLGDGEFVHASSAGEGVVVSQLNSGYYEERFLGGGRPAGWLTDEVTTANLPPEVDTSSETQLEYEQEVSVELLPTESSTTDDREDEPVYKLDPFSPVRVSKADALTLADAPIRNPSEAMAQRVRLISGELVALAQLEFGEVFGGVLDVGESLFQPFLSLRREDPI